MHNNPRYHYLDFLRVIAILLMFLYHVNMIFVVEWGWHVKNSDQSNVLMEVNYWMSFFRMPLLFFVSAFISCVLMEKLSNKEFVIQRFVRLILPLIVWTFVLVAPQIYFERKLQGVELSYPEFYLSFLEFNWWPNGNFHWLHLWFIPYLFVYNILSIPLVRVIDKVELRSMSDQHILTLILMYVAISVIPYIFMSLRFPVSYDLITDFARHALFIPFVIAGVLSYKSKRILNVVEKYRAFFFRSALLSVFIINTIRWNGLEPQSLWQNWLDQPISYLYLFLLNVNSWLWILAILGYGKRYLNKESKTLSYCNKAVYPFYILHQTVIVMIGYYVVQTNDPTTLKYAFILISCFFITWLTYHFYIRPFKYARILFGIR